MNRAGAKSGQDGTAAGLTPGAQREEARHDGAPDGETARLRRAREASDIRRVLGVETAFGFHVQGRAPIAIGIAVAARQKQGEAFPCLSDHSYSGCLGVACPLETCWTGGATVSFARKRLEESHISIALYLPGAPCHGCAHLVEDEVPVPAPRAARRSRSTRTGTRRAGRSDAQTGSEASYHRINCGQGLWAHPISLSSFLSKRIPMLDQDEPERCPGYAPRPIPHPAVAAHLQQRRERAHTLRERRGQTGHEP